MRAVEKGRAVYDNLNKFIRFVMLELVAYIITFLGASILNIAAGQPFSATQILYINFLVNAPLGHRARHGQGVAGAHGPRAAASRRDDHDARSADHRRPRRACSWRCCTLALISYGTTHYDSVAIGSVDGAHGVLAAHRRVRLPGQERDRHGAHERDRSTTGT